MASGHPGRCQFSKHYLQPYLGYHNVRHQLEHIHDQELTMSFLHSWNVEKGVVCECMNCNSYKHVGFGMDVFNDQGCIIKESLWPARMPRLGSAQQHSCCHQPPVLHAPSENSRAMPAYSEGSHAPSVRRSSQTSVCGASPLQYPNQYGHTPLSQLKKITLQKWFLIRLPEKQGEVGLAGNPANATYGSELVKTSAVVERIDKCRLRTQDGIEVCLIGHIDEEATLSNGFSSMVTEMFMSGFPFTWNYVLRETSDQRKREATSYDVRSEELIHGETSAHTNSKDWAGRAVSVDDELATPLTDCLKTIESTFGITDKVERVEMSNQNESGKSVVYGTSIIGLSNSRCCDHQDIQKSLEFEFMEASYEHLAASTLSDCPAVHEPPLSIEDQNMSMVNSIHLENDVNGKCNTESFVLENEVETDNSPNGQVQEEEGELVSQLDCVTDHLGAEVLEQGGRYKAEEILPSEPSACSPVNDHQTAEKQSVKGKMKNQIGKKGESVSISESGICKKSSNSEQKATRVSPESFMEQTSNLSSEHSGPPNRRRSSVLPPPLPSPRVVTPKAEVTQAFGLKTSRSGRIIVPPLAYWRNQATVHDIDGSIIAISDGFEEEPADTGYFNFKGSKSEDALRLQNEISNSIRRTILRKRKVSLVAERNDVICKTTSGTEEIKHDDPKEIVNQIGALEMVGNDKLVVHVNKPGDGKFHMSELYQNASAGGISMEQEGCELNRKSSLELEVNNKDNSIQENVEVQVGGIDDGTLQDEFLISNGNHGGAPSADITRQQDRSSRRTRRKSKRKSINIDKDPIIQNPTLYFGTLGGENAEQLQPDKNVFAGEAGNEQRGCKHCEQDEQSRLKLEHLSKDNSTQDDVDVQVVEDWAGCVISENDELTTPVTGCLKTTESTSEITDKVERVEMPKQKISGKSVAYGKTVSIIGLDNSRCCDHQDIQKCLEFAFMETSYEHLAANTLSHCPSVYETPLSTQGPKMPRGNNIHLESDVNGKYNRDSFMNGNEEVETENTPNARVQEEEGEINTNASSCELTPQLDCGTNHLGAEVLEQEGRHKTAETLSNEPSSRSPVNNYHTAGKQSKKRKMENRIGKKGESVSTSGRRESSDSESKATRVSPETFVEKTSNLSSEHCRPPTKRRSSMLPPPLPSPRVGTPKTEVTQALGLKTSRSGRIIVPPLAYWRNQATVHDVDGSIIAISDGFEEELVDTGYFNFKGSKSEGALRLQNEVSNSVRRTILHKKKVTLVAECNDVISKTQSGIEEIKHDGALCHPKEIVNQGTPEIVGKNKLVVHVNKPGDGESHMSVLYPNASARGIGMEQRGCEQDKQSGLEQHVNKGNLMQENVEVQVGVDIDNGKLQDDHDGVPSADITGQQNRSFKKSSRKSKRKFVNIDDRDTPTLDFDTLVEGNAEQSQPDQNVFVAELALNKGGCKHWDQDEQGVLELKHLNKDNSMHMQVVEDTDISPLQDALFIFNGEVTPNADAIAEHGSSTKGSKWKSGKVVKDVTKQDPVPDPDSITLAVENVEQLLNNSPGSAQKQGGSIPRNGKEAESRSESLTPASEHLMVVPGCQAKGYCLRKRSRMEQSKDKDDAKVVSSSMHMQNRSCKKRGRKGMVLAPFPLSRAPIDKAGVTQASDLKKSRSGRLLIPPPAY